MNDDTATDAATATASAAASTASAAADTAAAAAPSAAARPQAATVKPEKVKTDPLFFSRLLSTQRLLEKDARAAKISPLSIL